MKLRRRFLLLKNMTLATGIAASVVTGLAQQKYSEGIITYDINVRGQDTEASCYFKGDWSAYSFQQGPAKIKAIGNLRGHYSAVLVEVPVAGIKKAAIATPSELETMEDLMPQYSFTPTVETKPIGDYHCRKYRATNTKTRESNDVWATTDISIPTNILTRAYSSLPGVPVLFTISQQGVIQTVTLKSVRKAQVPADAFSIPADFAKVTMEQLQAR